MLIKQPPHVRYVYSYPGAVIIIVQDIRYGGVVSIEVQEYEIQ